MNKNRTAHRRRDTLQPNTDLFRHDAEAITSMVTAGKPNPFPAGSPEHIAFAWTGELQRHAASEGDTPPRKAIRRSSDRRGVSFRRRRQRNGARQDRQMTW